MNSQDSILHYSVYPDRICSYYRTEHRHSSAYVFNEETGEVDHISKAAHLINADKSTKGKVSKQAHRKISNALDYLLLLARPKNVQLSESGKHFQFRIAFITLTLPAKQIHTDNQIKSLCLNSFLIELKKIYRVKNYVWRAEKQKNGNIHFHIIIDKFIPWNELRSRWNRIINKLGYVDQYRNNMKEFYKNGFRFREVKNKKWDYDYQFNAYQKGKANDFNNPNSTDIHSIKKIKNLKSYVTKYLTKQPEQQNITENSDGISLDIKGRLWGCNVELSDVKGADLPVGWSESEELQKMVIESKCRVYKSDFFSVYYISISDLKRLKSELLLTTFIEFLSTHFDFHEQLTCI